MACVLLIVWIRDDCHCLIDWVNVTAQHNISSVRRPYGSYGIGLLWLRLAKPTAGVEIGELVDSCIAMIRIMVIFPIISSYHYFFGAWKECYYTIKVIPLDSTDC